MFNFTLFTFTNAQSFGTVKFLWVIISGEIVKKRSVTGRHAGARVGDPPDNNHVQ